MNSPAAKPFDAPVSRPPHPRRRRLSWMVVGLVVFGLLGVAGWDWSRPAWSQRVARQVRSEVPLGSGRAEVMAWISRNCPSRPTVYDDVSANRYQGRTVPELAGVSAERLGSMVCVVIPREGIHGRLRPDHVWVYFLLDRRGEVIGHYCLALSELAVMERDNVRGRTKQ